MSEMDEGTPPSGTATIVISHRVREGRGADFEGWQERVTRAASAFPGFETTEVIPPSPGVQEDWVTVFRFASAPELKAWLDSPERRDLLAEAEPLFESPPVVQVLAGAETAQQAVSAVVSHRVRPGREAEFERWQKRVTAAERAFEGFMGSELFKPVPGIQDDWVAVFRFDSRQHLDAWLGSEERQRLLEEAPPLFESYDVREVGTSFGGWFPLPGRR